MPPLRIVFAGSPAAAVPSLEALLESAHEIVAVVTREDSPQGRRGVLTPTPVAVAAEAAGIPVIKANRLAGAATDEITALDPDLGVIVAYGGLVREPLLSAPSKGWINLHFSVLPRWRGAAPVQRALIAGDETTGASVFQLVPELDAGDVFGVIEQPIGRFQTAGDLLASLSVSGSALLTRVVDDLASDTARAEAQVGEVTLAPKLSLADGEVRWDADADVVTNLIRGVTPEPGAFTTLDGGRFKILSAAIARNAPRLAPGQFAQEGKLILVGTATDPIELITVHPAGKKAMNAGDWWRGRPSGASTLANEPVAS